MPRLLFLLLCLAVAFAPTAPVVGQTTNKLKRYTVRGVQPLDAGSISSAEIGVSPGAELLVTGLNANGVILSQLYFGGEETSAVDRGDTTFSINFSLVTQTLEQVWRSSSLWYDFDRDGDKDLLLMGARNRETPFNPVTRLYVNDRGTLTPVSPATLLPGLYDGAVAMGDLFGDGRLFVVLTGRDAADAPFFGYYQLESFTTNAGTPSVRVASAVTAPFGLALAALALGDCDADGDLDLAISGINPAGLPQTTLYRNSGAGFSATAQALPGVFNGGMDWGDVDGDGDADLALTGATYGPALLEGTTRLYRSAGCTLTPDAPLPSALLAGNTALLRDHDGDGDLDLLLNGFMGDPAAPLARLAVYLNSGSGTFTLYDEQPGALYSNADWVDLNADGFLDPLTGGSVFGTPGLLLFRKPGLPPPPDEGD